MIRVLVVIMLLLSPLSHSNAALLQLSFDGVLDDQLADHAAGFSGWIILNSSSEQVEMVYSRSGSSAYLWQRGNATVQGNWDLPWFEYDDYLGSFVLGVEGFTRDARNSLGSLFDIYLDIELEGPDDALENGDFSRMYVAEFGSYGNFSKAGESVDIHFDNISLSVISQLPQLNTPAPATLLLCTLLCLAMITAGRRFRR